METEHSETVVEKAVAFVKDMLGMPPADKPPDVVANPEYTDTAPEPTIEGAMRLDPYAYTTKSVAEVNVECARRELSDTAFDEHTNAAAQINRARDSAEKAFDEIQDVSRGMRETNPEKNFPSDREMDEFERAEKDRQAQQHSAGW
jgi:hypothetical protein